MCALCGMQPSRRNKCLYFRLHFAETSKCVHFVDVISSLLQHTSHPIQITRIWADFCIKQAEGMVVRLCRQAMNHRSGHYFNICKLETTEQFEGEITVPVGVSKICEHYMTGYFSWGTIVHFLMRHWDSRVWTRYVRQKTQSFPHPDQMVLVPNLKNTAATYNWILNLKKYLRFTETDNANIFSGNWYAWYKAAHG